MRSSLLALLVVSLMSWGTAQAALGVFEYDTIEQEQRYKQLAEKLRCLV